MKRKFACYFYLAMELQINMTKELTTIGVQMVTNNIFHLMILFDIGLLKKLEDL